MKIIEDEQRVCVIEGPWSPESVIRDVVDAGQEDPFYVMDMGEVVARYHHWKELMPRVEPFYAVKCNDDKVLVSTLAALGAGFDCASKAEIQLVTELGVQPERIIFANPAKMASHIRYSSSAGVDMMTFDSETELLKIKQFMPHAKVVLRIRCDAAAAQCPLGIKFGADPLTEAPRLLKVAAVLNLNVVGVSFHVGSGAGEVGVYARGVALCRALFELAAGLGLSLSLLDIGGGFPGHSASSIYEVSQVINSALETHFPGRDVRVIAEPGRYFAAAAYTLAAMVHASRDIITKEQGVEETHTMYFINDGVYGSFNCVLYDHQQVMAQPLEPSNAAPLPCSIWGPSCDGLDCVVARAALPPRRAGDWLVFRDMGAYTLPVASPFNGFPVPRVTHCVSHAVWEGLSGLWPVSQCSLVAERRVLSPPTPPSSPSPSSPASPASPSSSSPAASPPPHHTVFVECALK